MEKGEYIKAIDCFKQQIKNLKDDEETFYYLGIAYYMNEDYVQAEKVFKQIIEWFKPTSDAYYNLGIISIKQKKYKEASEYFLKGVKLSSGDVELLSHLALIYIILGNFNGAIEKYTEAINIDRNNPSLYEGRSVAYWKIGDNINSKADLIKAKYLRSDIYLGKIKLVSKEKKEERKRIEFLPKGDPASLLPQAEIYLSIGDYEKALKLYNDIIKLAPNEPKYYRMRAKVYKLLGKMKEAEEDINKANKLEK